MTEFEFSLPSGLVVHVARRGDERPEARDLHRGERFFGGRLFRAIDEDALRVVRVADGSPLGATDLAALPMPDFHALRDAAARVGAIAVDAGPAHCRNCESELPLSSLAAKVADLVYWYVEDVPEVDRSPVALGGDGPLLTLHTTTAAEGRAFHRAAVASRFRLSGAVVRAMGITAFDGLEDPDEIASALDALSDELWADVEAAYEYFAYSPKSYFPERCPHCDALHDVPAPRDREVDSQPYPSDELPAFPDEDSFAALALDIGRDVYREMGVQNIELEVVTGVADVDDGGEPLLGSYQPRGDTDEAGIAGPAFLIRVYYRTFLRMYEDEPYDLEDEVRETIEHEVEHHLHHLRGYDPMDIEERMEGARELERTYGRRAMRRAEIAGAVQEARNLGWLLAATAATLGSIVLYLYLTGRL